jgi:hypothetical protein
MEPPHLKLVQITAAVTADGDESLFSLDAEGRAYRYQFAGTGLARSSEGWVPLSDQVLPPGEVRVRS